MQLIQQSDWKVTSWRSGLGETAEIAVFPAEGDLRTGAFDWRISLASMGEDAAFSAFPGFDRILTVVEGEGLELDARPDGPYQLAEPLVPVAFPGEHSVTGRLKNGAVKNLNLMTARSRAFGSVEILSIDGADRVSSGNASGVLLLSLGPQPAAVRDQVGRADYTLDAMSALLQCGGGCDPFELHVTGTPKGRLALIRINSGQS